IAYEYVPGRTMREALRAGELDDRAALEVCGQIADALAHAHRRGIVHRDVKPSNVLLAESPDIDVRLLDFGLAQMAEFDTLTGLGDIPGTLAYIAPERLQGLPATAAADVWGLGVVLWEALAGEHPFWGCDLSETSRSIQQGAPSLETLRPDLPRRIIETVDSALVSSPQRRPTAERLAAELRNLPRRRRKNGGSSGPAAPARSFTEVAKDRLLPGALAGVASGWVAAALPFYPAGWPLGLAALAATLGFASPRAGLLFALLTAFFPLANISTGLAIVYVTVAVLWAALNWRDARTGLLLAAGPLASPLAALALLPLVAQAAQGRARRALHVAAAVLLAMVVAGIRRVPFPFDGSTPPLGLGLAGSTRPTAVAHTLWAELVSHPEITAEALVLAAAAAAVPYARGRGPWPAVIFAGTLLSLTATIAPEAALLPLVAAAWLTAAVLAFQRAT
ncbi:MAG TPA: serine/threonine-protein kinase, partial [Gaiellaceae bacterium]